MWDLVASLQQTLDEAAGLQPGSTVSSIISDAGEGWRAAPSLSSAPGDARSPGRTKPGAHHTGESLREDLPRDMPSLACATSAATDTSLGDDSRAGSPHDSAPNRTPTAVVEVNSAPQENRGNTEDVLDHGVPSSPIVADDERLSGERIAQLQREGVELSLQLGAERARVKVITLQIKSLETQLSECSRQYQEAMRAREVLEDSLRAVQESEAAWKVKARQLEAMVVRLTDEQRQQAAMMHEGTARNSVVIESLTRRAEELERNAEDAERSHRDIVQQLHDDVEHWKGELHQQSLRHDEVVTALEHDVSAALRRAHDAECRLLDHEVHASQSLRELSMQLEAAEQKCMRTTSVLQSRVVAAETSCQNARRDADDSARQNLSLRESLRRVSLETDEKCGVLDLLEQFHTQRAALWQRCFNPLEPKCSTMTTAGAVVDMTTEVRERRCEALARPQTDALPCGVTLLVNPSSDASQGSSRGERNGALWTNGKIPADDNGNGAMSCRAATQATDRMIPATDETTVALVHPLGRLERELARLTRENRRLRLVEARWSDEHAQLESITAQHDLLLQMYGQQEENLEDLRSDLRAAKDIYRAQLATLGDEVAALQRELLLSTRRTSSSET